MQVGMRDREERFEATRHAPLLRELCGALAAVTLVLFPIVSKANAAGDEQGVETSVSAALRFSWLFLGALLAPLVGAAHGAVRFAFPATYAEAADVIPVLALSQFFFALAVLHATILVGRNLVLRVAAFAALALLVGLTTSMLLATFFDFATLPMRIALGTAMGSLVFFVATGAALLQRIKTRLRWLTIARACWLRVQRPSVWVACSRRTAW